MLVYKFEVVSSWRDRCTRIYLCVKNYVFLFIPRKRACLLLDIYNRRLLLCIAPVCCLCAYNIFGQRHPAPVTPAKRPHHTWCTLAVWQATCLVHAPAQPRNRNMLQSKDTQDTLLLHKAHTKARASSMPVHSRRYVVNNKTLYLSADTHAAETTTEETQYSNTRQAPRRMPRPCPSTTGVMKSRTDHLSAFMHAAKAMIEETHCSCTRHVPRRLPRPCPVHHQHN